MLHPHYASESGVYLGDRPVLIGASLVSSEEPRCLHCDTIWCRGATTPGMTKINPCLGAI